MTQRKIRRVMVAPDMLSELRTTFAPLVERGIDVVHNHDIYPMNAEQLALWLGDADAAIIGLDEVTEAVFEACPNLWIVARNGVGMDNVDIPAANAHNVIITAPFGANSTSVAELALGLLITLVRHVVPVHNDAQAGNWYRLQGMELAGKTLGIIGLGRIGKKVARRAQAFNMRVIANDIAPDGYYSREHQIPMMAFDEVLSQVDVLSLHVPLTPLTRHMINRDSLGKMKRGSYLINTARGGVVDSQALSEALDSGHIMGAALDVHPEEGVVEDCLLNRANVITTTHLGAYTRDSLQLTAEMAVQSIVDIFDGKRPAGLINSEIWENRQ
ncbi:MAG: phosphoglycerate dehydrogenase [Aggregatilineales bacterium]